ncbi:hypothetical protein C7B80_05505 [Cyanosarcina cf. burmensis CCALA 770]|jgi:transposase-like protein|nr:hypothetical protein C7B80_05505 [Cyanosarcina cf. burmensis CCALA 770]
MIRKKTPLGWNRNLESTTSNEKKKRQEAIRKTENAIKMLRRQKKAINFRTVSKAAGVSRSWLYKQPALKSKIERLREQQKPSASNIEPQQCPKCSSLNTKKNGCRSDGKQTYKCSNCNRCFVATYEFRGYYPLQVRECCLKLHLSGMSMRGVERATGVCHTTVRTWIKQVNISPA